MADNKDSVPGGVSAIVPLVMILSSMFAMGFPFLAVSGPLLLEWLKGKSPVPLSQLVEIVGMYWSKVHVETLGVTGGLAASAAAMMVGFVLAPISSFLVDGIGRTLSRIYKSDSYVLPAIWDEKYPRVVELIFENKTARQHWDWEFFNYFVYMGVFLNLALSSIAVWHLTPHRWQQDVVLIAACYSSLHFALVRTRLVRFVYEHYLQRAATDSGVTGAGTDAVKVERRPHET